MKAELGIQPVTFPKYSPDLNPMDFYVWSEAAVCIRNIEARSLKHAMYVQRCSMQIALRAHTVEVERRMALKKAPRGETVPEYKARLRRTAMGIPEATVRKAVDCIRKRAREVIEAVFVFAAFCVSLRGAIHIVMRGVGVGFTFLLSHM